jgi:uncharacterized protein
LTTPIDELGDFAALDPFFRIIEQGLAGAVDDGHFLDLLAEDVIFDYVISVPGYPRRVVGREASVIVLEYAVHGQAVQTGRSYDNHFVSVITIKDRKVAHWRDYLDPVAVFDALGWPAR